VARADTTRSKHEGYTTAGRSVSPRFVAVGLANNPQLILEQPTHMKLFFEHEDDSRYAAFYLNVDVAQSHVEFHEKDPE
jgi:hypothetical protein